MSRKRRLVVLISGSGTNLQALIDALNTPRLPSAEIVLVLSNRKAAYGLTRAANASPPIQTAYLALQPYLKSNPGKTRDDYDEEVAKIVIRENPDLVVLAGWMHILGDRFLDLLDRRKYADGETTVAKPTPVINLHPALPGAFDGANAIERAYEAFQKGEISNSGVMVHRVIKDVDRGEPLIVREVPIEKGEPIEAFEERLHRVEHEIIVQAAAKVLDEVAPVVCTPPRRLSEALLLPRLDIASTDLAPFSDSFSGLLSPVKSSPAQRPGVCRNLDMSYDIQNLTNLKELDSQWMDDDVEEILVMSRKQQPRPLPTITEDMFETSPTLNQSSLKLADFDFVAAENCYPASTICRRRDTNQIFEMKVFRGVERRSRNYQYILNAVSELCSPFLPRIHWSFKEGDTMYMILDWQTGQSISDLLSIAGPFEIRRLTVYAGEIAVALSHLHKARIVHRYLAPDNIIINPQGHIILTSFGSAMSIGGAKCLTEFLDCESQMQRYQAPELRLGWNHDFAVDCWGFGLVLFYMLHGKHPHTDRMWHHDREPSSVCSKMAHTRAHALGSDLAKNCLEFNPGLRYNLSMIQKHPFFNTTDWERVGPQVSNVPILLESAVIEDSYLPRLGEDTAGSLSTDPVLKQTPSRHTLQPSCSSLSNVDLSRTDTVQMSRLLDEFPKVQSNEVPTDFVVEPVPVDTQIEQGHSNAMNPQERMAQFWKSLDAEEQADSGPSKVTYADAVAAYCSRPLKLRKHRSTVTLNNRMSTFSTSSQGNLRKRISAFGRPPTSKQYEVPELPKGIEQIGNGIGYNYNIPEATLSKATICGQTPKARARYSTFKPNFSFNFNLGFVNGLWRNEREKQRQDANSTTLVKPPIKKKIKSESKKTGDMTTSTATTAAPTTIPPGRPAQSLDRGEERPQDATFLRQIYGTSSNLSLGLLMSPSSTIVVSPSMVVDTAELPTQPSESTAFTPDVNQADGRIDNTIEDKRNSTIQEPVQRTTKAESLERSAHEAKEGDPKCTLRLVKSSGLRLASS
ncbi:hypothetical protein AX16_009905 [Volvariella volvacea WC 439]|nr:hypothetical protein AX16_009905 [Volvariella volvacea WC 439]